MASKAYQDGYLTGLFWTDNYRPGGPWIMTSRHNDKPDFIERCEQSKQENKEWLEGFDNGLKEQKAKLSKIN